MPNVIVSEGFEDASIGLLESQLTTAKQIMTNNIDKNDDRVLMVFLLFYKMTEINKPLHDY
jgi:hypothetical protein